MKVDLHGRVALVTGAASGIGAVIAERLTSAGARVVVGDISEKAMAAFSARNPEIVTAACDVSDLSQVNALFNLAESRFGRVSIVVSNAGIAGPTARVQAIAPDAWDETLKVNLSGAFYCSRRAAPAMIAANDGVIIIISSVAGRLGFPLRLPYAVTKWGLIGMMETLAMELGPSNIRVNAVLPGLVDNERAHGIVAAQAERTGTTNEVAMQQFLSRISMRTMVATEEIATTVAFLASDFGRHISGQSISVCGNFESYGSPAPEQA